MGDESNRRQEAGDPVASLLASHGFSDEVNPSETGAVGPSATTDQVLHCQLSSWYPVFSNMEGRKRKKVTIQSVIIDTLPHDFKDYVLSDGVQLPVGVNPSSVTRNDSDSDWSDEDDGNTSENEANKEFHFPQLNEQIESAIASLGGAVMPKLNWSAPKDATWVNGGSLKCESAGDVYVLVKSSDFCLHDILRNSLQDCEDFDESSSEVLPLQLVLKKWCNLHPSMEFRCFVRDRELLAISQRNHTQHYPHLLHDAPAIRDKLLDFFEDVIRERFADGMVPNYVVDVYMDQKDRVWILDFNIWARSTDSLLFEWPELMIMDGDEDEPVMKIVETAQQVRHDPLASYRAPIDTVDLANMTKGDSKQFEEFMKQCRKPSEQ